MGKGEGGLIEKSRETKYRERVSKRKRKRGRKRGRKNIEKQNEHRLTATHLPVKRANEHHKQ